MSTKISLTRGWALDRVYNSRRAAPSHSCDTALRHARTTVSSRLFVFFDPVTLTFDLILIGGRWASLRGIVMDCLCAKFGGFTFCRFGFIVRRDRITEADDRYIHATIVGVSN